MVDDFVLYADVCFREFGDRVKYWTTVNEPNVMGSGGYGMGIAPPARCSPPFGLVNCTRGNSSTEPYIAVHHILLAHASVVKLYRTKYRDKQHGFVGITIYVYWSIPSSHSKEDITATQRANDFLIGWILDPLVFGDYPATMKKNAGSRIPSFTKLESELVKGSFDFVGIEHYMIAYVKDSPSSLMTEQRDYYADQAVSLLLPDPLWGFELSVNPWALEGVLEYIKQVYGNPPVFVYENGQRMRLNSSVEDTPRVEYLQAYIGSVLNALRNGSNTRGYVTWSFLDVFELFGGYESTYGLCYVDFDDPDLKRYPKLSAHWYSRFLKGKTVDRKEVTIEFEESSSALSS